MVVCGARHGVASSEGRPHQRSLKPPAPNRDNAARPRRPKLAFFTRLRCQQRNSESLSTLPDHQQGSPRAAPGHESNGNHHQPGSAGHLSSGIGVEGCEHRRRAVRKKGESWAALTLSFSTSLTEHLPLASPARRLLAPLLRTSGGCSTDRHPPSHGRRAAPRRRGS